MPGRVLPVFFIKTAISPLPGSIRQPYQINNAEIGARQTKLEKVIAAKTELDAAELQLKTAQAEARAAVALAEAEKAVIAAGNKADVEILKRNISAFGGGEAYLRGKLYEKVAPNIQQIMSNSAGEQLFGLPVLKKSLNPGRK